MCRNRKKIASSRQQPQSSKWSLGSGWSFSGSSKSPDFFDQSVRSIAQRQDEEGRKKRGWRGMQALHEGTDSTRPLPKAEVQKEMKKKGKNLDKSLRRLGVEFVEEESWCGRISSCRFFCCRSRKKPVKNKRVNVAPAGSSSVSV
jgi:hypothetical protein